MRFFKNNSDSIVKLFVNQIGVAIFSMFLYTAAGAINSEDNTRLLIKVLISIFSIAFYYVLIYTVTWEVGAKDKIKIDSGRLEDEKGKGILLGIFANLFNFVIISSALIIYAIFLSGGNEGFKAAFAILNLIFRFFVSMYLGLIQLITSGIANEGTLYLIQTALFLIFSFVSALVTYISYKLGRKDFRIIKYKSRKQ